MGIMAFLVNLHRSIHTNQSIRLAAGGRGDGDRGSYCGHGVDASHPITDDGDHFALQRAVRGVPNSVYWVDEFGRDGDGGDRPPVPSSGEPVGDLLVLAVAWIDRFGTVVQQLAGTVPCIGDSHRLATSGHVWCLHLGGMDRSASVF